MKCPANKSSRPSRTLAAILGACALAFASTSFAVGVWGDSTIRIVYPDGDGNFILLFHNSPAECQDPNGYFRIKVGGVYGHTQEGVNNLYRAALLAASTKKSLNFYFDSETCEIADWKMYY